jgi:hypothetical protein
MAKRVPKHIIRKLERMSKLMGQLTDLNMELEEWMEANGIEDGFDFTYDYRHEPAYEIHRREDFIKALEAAIN